MLRRASFEGEVVAGEPADPCRRLRLKFSDRVFMPVLDLNQRRAMVSSSCLSTSRQLYAAAGCRRRSREGGYGRASPPVCSPTGTSGSFSPLGADRVTCALLVRHEHDANDAGLAYWHAVERSGVRAFGHSVQHCSGQARGETSSTPGPATKQIEPGSGFQRSCDASTHPATTTERASGMPAQKREPGPLRKTISSAVDCRPRIALR